MCPPSVASVAARGEWYMGAVLDVYWYFCASGDHFLGTVLAGLDPNKLEFASLPTHFMTEFDPMEDPDILEAMNLVYGPILEQWSGPKRSTKLVYCCLCFLQLFIIQNGCRIGSQCSLYIFFV